MARGGAHFLSEELVRVLSHYDIGVVHRVRPLEAGDRRAAKVVIMADKGTFLLKRRPRGADDLARVNLAHAVQRHLTAKSFPVPSLLATGTERSGSPTHSSALGGPSTALSIENHIYEFFHFVEGSRFDGSAEETREAGRQLAVFHKSLADFDAPDEPSPWCFHDSATVRRYLRMLASDQRTQASRQMKTLAEALLLRYDKSSARVNLLGFASWQRQIIHGDWHPGNLLFAAGRVVAVVDFDSIRVSPPVTDLANGMLQFSIVGDRPDPADWSSHFAEDRLFDFLNGYREIAPLSERKRYGLVDLMIETMIAEAVLPVAATGFFGRHAGFDWLLMILRKTKWLRHHRRELRDRMLA